MTPTLNKDTEARIEQIAMNIVHQIGDELMERGIITVKQRQETNDLFIDFTSSLLAQEIHKAEERVREEAIKAIERAFWDGVDEGEFDYPGEGFSPENYLASKENK